MPIELLSEFSRGLISEYDIDTNKVPKNALKDCINVEINRPLFMLKKASGYDTELNIPEFSGARTVLVRRWGIELLGGKELTTLVRASENLLKFSEDFEMSSVWSFTPAGASLTPNNADAPKRRADLISSPSSGTKLEQQLGSAELSAVSGKTVIFSVYAKSASTGSMTISVVDNNGSSSNTVTVLSTVFKRFSVSRQISGGVTSVTVRIEFTGDYSSIHIWGAQLEINSGDIPYDYGMTGRYTRPYYIFLYPYYLNGVWVNDWLELTEQRHGKVSNLVAGSGFDITGIDGTDYYYINWRVLKVSGSSQPLYVYDYTQSTGTFTTNNTTGLANGDEIGVCRFQSAFESPYIQQGIGIDERYITVIETYSEQRISFGSVLKPLIIKYKSVVNAFLSPRTINYDTFVLCYSSHTGVFLSTNGSENCGVSIKSVTGVTGAGSFAAGTYYIALVMVIDGQRFYVNRASVTLSGTMNTIRVSVGVNEGYFNPRLVSVEIYVGTSSEDWNLFYATSASISGSTWPFSSPDFVGVIDITDINSLNPSLLQNLGRVSSIESRAKFDLQYYIRGRRVIAGGQTSADYVRFSHISGLNEWLDDFAYVESEGYGYIIADPGTIEGIVGFCATRDNDLLIFKESSVMLYEVQSGGPIKRLVRIVNGIGLSTHRGIVSSDYGVFWYDSNGVYMYSGGISSPIKISEGRLSNYFRNVLKQYLPYSFAIFNRKLSEYWIFTQKSGNVGSSDYNDYVVLRYSPEYSNWNLLRFPFVPVSVSEKVDGEIILCSATSSIFKYGYSTNQLGNCFALTHPLQLNSGSPKLVKDIDIVYNVSNNLLLHVIVDDEQAARSGNVIQYLSAVKHMERQPRQGTKFTKLSLKFEQSGGNTFEVSQCSVDYIDLKERYARR